MDFSEGIRPYWENVSQEGDLMTASADCYFLRRVAPAWFRYGCESFSRLNGKSND